MFKKARQLHRQLLQTIDNAAIRFVKQAGYDVINKTIYSPVPELPCENSSQWLNRTALTGIAFDPSAQLIWAKKIYPHISMNIQR